MVRFKEVFSKQYYPKTARLQRQQEFTHLTQNGRFVDAYAREFMRLKRFAPSQVDIESKMAKRFIIVLDAEIHHTV